MKMFLSALVFFAVSAQAETVTIERITNAKLCYSSEMAGSSDSLVIPEKSLAAQKSYLVDVLNSEKYSVKSMMKENRVAGKCIKITVTGYKVKEKGHFPNPMAAFDVFKVMDISKF